jgi:hypothetical protein
VRTAREVPTPLLCRNSMISRMTFCSAQSAMIRSAHFHAQDAEAVLVVVEG